MTRYEKIVKDIADEVYKIDVQQILIDLIQDKVEELFDIENPPSRDKVGACSYRSDILLEVYNPKFKKDIDILKRLTKALDEWANDIEATNILLGIPKQS